MRTAAKVGEVALCICSDMTVLKFGDQLTFICFATVPEHFECIGLGDVSAYNLLILLGKFKHLGLDSREIGRRDGMAVGVDIVIEAVFDSRSDTEFHTGEKFLQRLSEEVGRTVPESMLAFIVIPLEQFYGRVGSDGTGKIPFLFVYRCSENVARELKETYDHLILVCGHYEGIDQRFIDECVDEELSMGDFVVTGGEIPAMAVTDAICRMVPGVLPEEECFTEESHWAGLLEYPQYSRPDEWHGRRVPDVLLSGHHENVAKWRKKESYKRTMLRRPDLWAQFDEKQLKAKSEKKVLAEAKAEAEAIRAAEVKKAEESDTETTVE